ncbi:MAG: bifunctional folylpolyglutamate synthase/dihydrofolate synthase [Coprococcus sp.]
MTNEEAWNYIEEINKAGSVPGLDNIKELLCRLDNPQDRLKVVHVAGTNGKGSVCAFLEGILIDAGYRVGRYISPTIFSYFERFQINKKYMCEDDFRCILEKVKNISDQMVKEGYARPTAFETETAVSFLYFLDNNVDIVLLETGMGGLKDATNVCRKPLCTILTSISMDHMNFFGDNIYDILNEKLGIIKHDVPCVSDNMTNEMKRIWFDKCEEMHCPHIMLDMEKISVTENTLDGVKYIYKNKEYAISMIGKNQINNSILAIEAANVLKKQGYDLDYVNVYNGLYNTNWKGRFQKISDNPLIYVDGAHNEGGWSALKDNIQTYFEGRKLIYVCGVLKDKEYKKMLDILSPYSDYFIAVTPDSPRALPKELLSEYASDYIENTCSCELNEALDKACEIAGRLENPVILVYGSLSFIGPVIERYGK